jgi:hypothetical protein
MWDRTELALTRGCAGPAGGGGGFPIEGMMQTLRLDGLSGGAGGGADMVSWAGSR